LTSLVDLDRTLPVLSGNPSEVEIQSCQGFVSRL